MKKKIAVIFGGKSAEHEVSILTAHIPIIPALKATGKFDVIPIYISEEGYWYSHEKMNNIEYFKNIDFRENILKEKKLELLFDNGLIIIKPGLVDKKIKIDVAFPAMHGTYGEDGSLMGLLRMAGVPYVGCDLFSSAISMDKVITKQILKSEGIKVVPFIWFAKDDWQKDKISLAEKLSKLTWPLFVKPVHLGSSIAITKVKNKTELENAIEVAFHYDNKLLIEESIENLIEVTLPIMGNNKPKLGYIERPLNKSTFFDFNDKYLSGNKKGSNKEIKYSELPAKIGDILSTGINHVGKKTYKTLGCSGIARIDFLIDKSSGDIYVNEVNTLPGSLYHHNWRARGISSSELVTELVELAEQNFEHDKKINHIFKSEILRLARGSKISNE